MQIMDEWSTIVAGKGMLLGIDNKTARAAGPQVKDNTASGEGWTLTLKSGWVVVPGERAGDYTLKKVKASEK